MFVTSDELKLFAPGSLFVDVSCDEGMGFDWARPTSFAQPMFSVGSSLHYYAVDHSPSHLWNSATWEISEALIPFLAIVMSGEKAWDANRTIHHAIEIRTGVVQNPKILTFRLAPLPSPTISWTGSTAWDLPADPPAPASAAGTMASRPSPLEWSA